MIRQLCETSHLSECYDLYQGLSGLMLQHIETMAISASHRFNTQKTGAGTPPTYSKKLHLPPLRQPLQRKQVIRSCTLTRPGQMGCLKHTGSTRQGSPRKLRRRSRARLRATNCLWHIRHMVQDGIWRCIAPLNASATGHSRITRHHGRNLIQPDYSTGFRVMGWCTIGVWPRRRIALRVAVRGMIRCPPASLPQESQLVIMEWVPKRSRHR